MVESFSVESSIDLSTGSECPLATAVTSAVVVDVSGMAVDVDGCCGGGTTSDDTEETETAFENGGNKIVSLTFLT